LAKLISATDDARLVRGDDGLRVVLRGIDMLAAQRRLVLAVLRLAVLREVLDELINGTGR
jgi:hypothetical protein